MPALTSFPQDRVTQAFVQARTVAHNVRLRRAGWWIIQSGVLGLTLAGAVGCAAETPENTAVDVVVETGPGIRIYGGEDDTDAKATTSVVALKVARGDNFELCSGALIAPNVVLTARHCVTTSVTTSVSCDENGHSTNGPHVGADLPASDVAVYTGASPKFSQKPAAVAKAFVGPAGDSLCDADIALVVLDQPIVDASPLAVRLGGRVAAGETVRSVGYGQNDKLMPIGTRLRRDGVAILAMGAGISKSRTALGAHEFEVGESICEGDSGGPAISETTGAVVGVVSRGGNCDDQSGHIYTTTTGWNELFDKAFALAQTTPVAEPPLPEVVTTTDATEPAPAATNGAACAATRGPVSSGSAIVVAAATAAMLRLRRKRSV